MHAFVLHNKTFSKTPTILLESIQKNFNDEITRKIALSNPNLLEFEHCKRFETTTSEGIWSSQGQKKPEITSLTWKVEKPLEWKSLKVVNKRSKKRFPK